VCDDAITGGRSESSGLGWGIRGHSRDTVVLVRPNNLQLIRCTSYTFIVPAPPIIIHKNDFKTGKI
jgi:hypothetical protein